HFRLRPRAASPLSPPLAPVPPRADAPPPPSSPPPVIVVPPVVPPPFVPPAVPPVVPPVIPPVVPPPPPSGVPEPSTLVAGLAGLAPPPGWTARGRENGETKGEAEKGMARAARWGSRRSLSVGSRVGRPLRIPLLVGAALRGGVFVYRPFGDGWGSQTRNRGSSTPDSRISRTTSMARRNGNSASSDFNRRVVRSIPT